MSRLNLQPGARHQLVGKRQVLALLHAWMLSSTWARGRREIGVLEPVSSKRAGLPRLSSAGIDAIADAARERLPGEAVDDGLHGLRSGRPGT